MTEQEHEHNWTVIPDGVERVYECEDEECPAREWLVGPSDEITVRTTP